MKKTIITLFVATLAMTHALAQRDEMGYPIRVPDERVFIFSDYSKRVALFASEDHDNPGEILVYYYIPNSPVDSVFLVFDKAGCEEMVRSLETSRRKLDEWHKVAKKNRVDRLSKDVDIPFPEVNVYWKMNRPDYGEFTHYPYFIWAGKNNWLQPKLDVYSGGVVFLVFEFYVPDATEKPYRITYSLNRPRMKEYPRYFDYEKIKKIYRENTPDRSGWSDLFH